MTRAREGAANENTTAKAAQRALPGESGRFVVLTGLSGAGKTTALHALEDLGYFTVDNLPPALWLELVASLRRTGQTRVVVGVDVRGRAFLGEVEEALRALQDAGVGPEIVFLEASDDVLVGRYNLTRRTHPLGQAPLSEDIASERQALGPLRALADAVLDTSAFSARRLTDELRERYGGERAFHLRLVSFGFKRGVPIDADNVFDLRALPNPFYDPALRPLDGRDAAVQAHVFSPEGLAFYSELRNFVRFLTLEARNAGRGSYTVAVGCTGGQHRSVAVAERLHRDLAETFATHTDHRDVAEALAEHGAEREAGHREKHRAGHAGLETAAQGEA